MARCLSYRQHTPWRSRSRMPPYQYRAFAVRTPQTLAPEIQKKISIENSKYTIASGRYSHGYGSGSIHRSRVAPERSTNITNTCHLSPCSH